MVTERHELSSTESLFSINSCLRRLRKSDSHSALPLNYRRSSPADVVFQLWWLDLTSLIIFWTRVQWSREKSIKQLI